MAEESKNPQSKNPQSKSQQVRNLQAGKTKYEQLKEDVKDEVSTNVINKLVQLDAAKSSSKSKALTIIFSVMIALFIGTIVVAFYYMDRTINDMYLTYIKNTEDIIRTRADIELSNAWERLPVGQRKERLREQYFQIIRYYTNAIPEEQKMSNEQIVDSFNNLWACTETIPAINFFVPVAYMKVSTNFNPVYNVKYKRGVAALYLKTAESIANLPLVRNDSSFRVEYKGLKTVNNPSESVKLLAARIDDLMTTFSNREDWVLLALFTNEYDVIDKYWENGDGNIPDELYEAGELAEALKYYHAFKNWQIPAVNIEEVE